MAVHCAAWATLPLVPGPMSPTDAPVCQSRPDAIWTGYTDCQHEVLYIKDTSMK